MGREMQGIVTTDEAQFYWDISPFRAMWSFPSNMLCLSYYSTWCSWTSSS